MGDHYPTVRVAAVQAASVFLDREASVEKACRLILEAGANGAELIVFPEGFIPGHPLWYHFRPATDRGSVRLAARLVENAVVVGGKETSLLAAAAREARATVVMGLAEKLPGTFGTLFNSQLFIGPDGAVLGKHQKLVPTVGERLVHTGGFGDTVGAVETPVGRVGGLICGEASNPLLVFALLAEHAMIQAISWPARFQKEGVTCAERALLAGRSVASMSKAYVVNAIGAMSEDAARAIAFTDEDREILGPGGQSGGSSVIDPFGQVIAGPLGGEEGVLYADLDLEACVLARIEHDFSGHYNRADVFRVEVNTRRPEIYRKTRDEREAPGAGAEEGPLGAVFGAPADEALDERIPDS